MKWIWIMSLLILAIEAQAGTLPSKIRIGTDQMRPWVDREDSDHGIISRIVIKAFGRAQIQLAFDWMPWKRLFHPVHSHEVNAVFPMGFNEERASIFHYSDELIRLDRIACHLKTQPFAWTSPEDFRGKTIAFRRGAYFGPLYDQLRDENIANFIEADNDLSMIKMLLTRRVDLFFCQPREMQLSMKTYAKDGLLRADEVEKVSTRGRPILSAPLHIGFPRHTLQGGTNIISVQLKNRFNKGLAQLKAAEPHLFHVHQH